MGGIQPQQDPLNLGAYTSQRDQQRRRMQEDPPTERADSPLWQALRTVVSGAARSYEFLVRNLLSPLPPGAPTGAAQAPSTALAAQQVGIDDPEKLGETMMGSGMLFGAYIAPWLMMATGGTSTLLRKMADDDMTWEEAAGSALREGLGLAQPVRELLEQHPELPLSAEVAEVIEQHPFIAEIVLNLGHDLSVVAATRQLAKLADLSPQMLKALEEATARTAAEMATDGVPLSKALAAAERMVMNRPVLERSLSRQMTALLEQRRAVAIAEQRAMELADASGIGTVGRTAERVGTPELGRVEGLAGKAAAERPPTDLPIARGGEEVLQPEPGLIDLAATLAEEPRALGVTGREQGPLGFAADLPRMTSESDVVSLGGRQATVIDQLAGNLTREAIDLADAGSDMAGAPAIVREQARNLGREAPKLTGLGAEGPSTLVRSAPKGVEVGSPPAWTIPPRRQLAPPRGQSAAARAAAELEPAAMRAREAAPATVRARIHEPVVRLARRVADAGDNISTPLAREMQEAGLDPAMARAIASTGKVTTEQATRIAGRTGYGVTLYGGLMPDLTKVGIRTLTQAGLLGGGWALTGSDNDWLDGLGWTMIAIGGGSLLAPALSRAGKYTAAKAVKAIAEGAKTYTPAGQTSVLTADEIAVLVGRWFAPEYGMPKEFSRIITMQRAIQARIEGLGLDYGRRIARLSREAGRRTQREARAMGFTRAEARTEGAREVKRAQRALSDIAEGERGGLTIDALPPDLHDEALAITRGVVETWEEIGRMQVELGRFSQFTFDLRSGAYIPRFYLDFEKNATRMNSRSLRAAMERRLTGKGRFRVGEVGIRDDGIPYHVRVEDLKEIRELGYRTLRGFSRDAANVSNETAFKMIRDIPGRVWQEHDRALLAMERLRAQRTALMLSNAPRKDVRVVEKALSESRKALREIEKTPPTGFRQLERRASLGSMSGRFVDADTFLFLRDYPTTVGKVGGAMDAVIGVWKFAMTALNLPTHVGNIGSNVILAHLIGGLPWWRADFYSGALADYLVGHGVRVSNPSVQALLRVPGASRVFQGGGLYRDLRNGGILGRTLIERETGGLVRDFISRVDENPRRLLRELYPAETGNAVPTGVKTVHELAAKVPRALSDMYRMEEEMFKVAVYAYRRSIGESAETAGRVANTALIDYSNKSGFVNFMNRTMIPFFTFPAKVAGPLMKATLEHPERLPLALAPFITMDLLSRNVLGTPALQPYDQNKRGPFDIRYTQIPLVTEDGELIFVNTGRYTPYGPFITPSPVEMLTPDWWPQALTPSHPVLSAASLLFNRHPVTGEPVVSDIQSGWEKFSAIGGQVAQLAVPSMISRNLPRVVNALDREAVDEALIEMAGVIGLRPTMVSQTGDIQRASAFKQLRDLQEFASRAMADDLRKHAGTRADSLRIIQERAKVYGERFQRIMQEMLENVPQQ